MKTFISHDFDRSGECPFGGRTTVYSFSEDGKYIFVGVSYCSEKEGFRKSVGTEIANKRMETIRKMYENKEISDLNTDFLVLGNEHRVTGIMVPFSKFAYISMDIFEGIIKPNSIEKLSNIFNFHDVEKEYILDCIDSIIMDGDY